MDQATGDGIVGRTQEPDARPGRLMGVRRRTFRLLVMALSFGAAAVLVACGDDDTSEPVTTDAGGPITVQQLVERSADTPVAVQGLLHVSDGVTRLCGAILESYPPQCGEPSVELVGLDLATVEGLTSAEGVTWKEGAVLNLERADDGRFTVLDVQAGLTTEVVLGIYSGVPDPAWTLTAEESNELAAALATLPEVSGTAAPGGLGYHGFTIESPDGTLVAFDGKVAEVGLDPPSYLNDPDRTIERLLLDTARPHVTPEVLTEVERSLDLE